MRSRAFRRLFSGLNINTCVFQEFSLCEIFLPLMLPFLMEFKAFKRYYHSTQSSIVLSSVLNTFFLLTLEHASKADF